MYIGYVYAKNTVGLIAQLLMGLVINNIASVEGVVEALRVVLAVLVVWLKAFLAFNCLARALIW